MKVIVLQVLTCCMHYLVGGFQDVDSETLKSLKREGASQHCDQRGL